MNILLLSDLHNDTCENFGPFQLDEMDHTSQIEGVRDIYNVDNVIFNGDIPELHKYRYQNIIKAIPLLIRYFK
jgi:metallophosphoesterase superfamily enzyme